MKQVVDGPARAASLEECGSLLLGDKDHAEELHEEYKLLRQCGVEDMELWDEKKVKEIHGEESEFVNGVYFPNDIRVDPIVFVQGLLKACKRSQTTKVTVIEYSPSLSDVSEDAKEAYVLFQNGVKMGAKHVILATNALFLSTSLAGILKPCWSYFVALPHPRDPLKDASVSNSSHRPSRLLQSTSSMNFFTYGFTHDWCVTNGVFRISGEDHFSALKPPRAVRRCKNLAQWALKKYPHMVDYLGPDGRHKLPASAKLSAAPKWLEGRYVYGVYGETPDFLPLIGKQKQDSKICYVVGCNAWGQATMTYCASLVPGLLDYSKFTPQQAELADLVAVSRFKTQEVYLKYKQAAKL